MLAPLGWIFTLSLLFYTQTVVFDFAETRPFGGRNIFNPYQDTEGKVVKANFHAHSKAWGGFTNGHNTPEELIGSYHQKGYAFAGVSNYFAVNRLNSPLKVYEHGLNLMKSHKLAINPSSVVYFDYPLLQNTSQKQDIINRLRDQEALVVLAHPNFMKGHSEEDMKYLSGYHFIEVLNHYRTSDKEWDAALKTGHLAWIMANDDTHDIFREPTHRIWNEIYVSSDNPEAMLDGLQKGHCYGIQTVRGINDLRINELTVSGDTLQFDFGDKAKQVQFILDGIPYYTHHNGRGNILFPPDAGYIRIVASSEESTIYTNPLVRYGDYPPLMAAEFIPTLNFPQTYFHRFLFAAAIIGMILLLTGVRPRMRRRFRSGRKRQPAYS